MLQKGVGCVIITLGSEGALFAYGDKRILIPAIKVDATDTTAAGDAFTGAMAVALGEGKDLESAAIFAVHAAAISVTRMGAQSSLPSRGEVEEMIHR